MIKCWIEAMRLRTLPVSVAGVILAIGLAVIDGGFAFLPAFLCLLFAVLAQIASNFANEYYDFRDGLDRKGREGPRRGVTEGDITPQAMKSATYLTLMLACAVGCSLIYYGGWWLVAVGLFIAVGVLAYSAGPYPLSRHALGEVAVIFFFGIVPVNFTYYLMTLDWNPYVMLSSLSAGLMGANVLIVNNYRDCDDDRAVGKITLAVKLGRRRVASLYLANGYVAVMLMLPVWMALSPWVLFVPAVYLFIHTALWRNVSARTGAALNPLLGMTSMAMLFYCLTFAVTGLFFMPF